MLWVKAFHVIFMVTWFSGIFYLPRLYVYHALAKDTLSIEHFKIMERRLYYGIMTPAGILTTFFGIWLLMYNLSGYLQQGWLQLKLLLVVILWIYHLYCGHLRKVFRDDRNQRSDKFYRIFNELPVFLLVAIVILVIVRPF